MNTGTPKQFAIAVENKIKELTGEDFTESLTESKTIKLDKNELDILFDIAEKYTATSYEPGSLKYDEQLKNEISDICNTFNVKPEEAKQLMIDYLAFDKDAFDESLTEDIRSYNTWEDAVMDVLDKQGYNTSSKNTINYAESAAELLNFSDTSPNYASALDWYNETAVNYPEDLMDLPKKDESLTEGTLSQLRKSGYTIKEIQKMFETETGLDMTSDHSKEFKEWSKEFLKSINKGNMNESLNKKKKSSKLTESISKPYGIKSCDDDITGLKNLIL